MFVSDGIKLTYALFQLGVDKTDAISVWCGSKAIIWNSEIKLKVPKMPFVNFAQINVYRRTGFIAASSKIEHHHSSQANVTPSILLHYLYLRKLLVKDKTMHSEKVSYCER